MKQTHMVTLGLTIIAVSLVSQGAFFLPGGVPKVEAEARGLTNEPTNAVLQQKIALLEGQLEKMSLVKEQVQDGAGPVPDSVDEPQVTLAPAPEQEKFTPGETDDFAGEEQARSEEIASRLEQHLFSEGVDQAWSLEAQALIADELAQKYVDGESTLASVNCQSTLCRIEVNHAGIEAEENFVAVLGQLNALADTEAYYTRREGSLEEAPATVVYIARQGHQLPQLENQREER